MSDGWRVESGSDGRRVLLALVGALVLVLAAIVIRVRSGGDDGGSGAGDDLTVVCPTELADVCEQAVGDDMTVEIQQPLDTEAALVDARSADDVDADVWLAPRPWVEAVAAQRELANAEPLLGDPTAPVARSPVVLLGYADRVAALESGAACGGAVGWRCLGDVAGRQWGEVGGESSWGTVKAAIADPASASGLAVLGTGLAGYLDTSDYATNDLEDPGLAGWMRGLGRIPASAGEESVTRMATRGPGELSLLGTVEAYARVAGDGRGLEVLVPDPVATVDLVVVPIGGDGDAAGELAGDDALLDALASAGWRVEGRELADGLDRDLTLPDDDGLPAGEVLRATLTRWQEAT